VAPFLSYFTFWTKHEKLSVSKLRLRPPKNIAGDCPRPTQQISPDPNFYFIFLIKNENHSNCAFWAHILNFVPYSFQTPSSTQNHSEMPKLLRTHSFWFFDLSSHHLLFSSFCTWDLMHTCCLGLRAFGCCHTPFTCKNILKPPNIRTHLLPQENMITIFFPNVRVHKWWIWPSLCNNYSQDLFY